VQTQDTETNQWQRQWQLQPQPVSTPQSVVSHSRSIHRFRHSDMTPLVFATTRLMELYMWNRRPFMSASDLEMVSYTMQQIAKALAEAPHWQIIEKYWNTTMQQNNIWSIAFEACTKEILKDVCWSNGPRSGLHTQTGTRFEHNSTKLNPIRFNQQGTTYQSCIISTALCPTQSVWDSSIPFCQTIRIVFPWQSLWKVVYEVQIYRRERRELRTNGPSPLYFLLETNQGLI